MALLEDARTKKRFHLSAMTEVGRSPRCFLHIDDTRVSALHAALAWNADEGWRVRDLGSSNGTFLNGKQLPARGWHVLNQGAVLSFGDSTLSYELVDNQPPRPVLVSSTGDSIVVAHETLALPDEDAPLATLFRSADGHWQLETDDALVELKDEASFQVGELSYRFLTLGAEVSTPTSGIALVPDLMSYSTAIRVSRDEEHIELELTSAGVAYKLEARAYWYLLLVLARHKLEDQNAGLPEASAGWIQQSEVEDAMRVAFSRVNLDVFRIRKRFAELPIQGAAQVIERRGRTGQLRTGLVGITIEKP